MPTPAEIIAARANGTLKQLYPEVHALKFSDTTVSAADFLRSAPASARTISDESAFPALGGSAKKPVAESNSQWGPLMVTTPLSSPLFKSDVSDPSFLTQTPSLSPCNKGSSVFGASSKFKPSTIQEAFSLDVADQLNVSKLEFIKILTSIKSDTKTSIEATTSHHIKKRTFLISGKPEDVRQAKALVIRKLTKPVSVSFPVPAILRSRIIGAQGKILRPIIEANDVKIDIGTRDSGADALSDEANDNDVDEDDVYAKSVIVSISGDSEGCKRAKALIMAIVDQETKNLSIRFAFNPVLRAFAPTLAAPTIANYPDVIFFVPAYDSASSAVVINGSRNQVLHAKSELTSAFDAFFRKLSIVNVPIPRIKHQFLPIASVLESSNVFIKLPEENETDVCFIGEVCNIRTAQELARNVTSQYKVDVLEMSKAHKSNLAHVKAVAMLLSLRGDFKCIAEKYGVVVNSPLLELLESTSCTSVPIELVSNAVTDSENLKLAKKEIVHAVNALSPDLTMVITDVDPFLFPQVESHIKQVSVESNVQYVVLGNSITLFSIVAEDLDSGDDFDFIETKIDRSGLSIVNAALNPLRQLSKNINCVTLQVPKQDQVDFIAGPCGSTLKLILADVESNCIKVLLHNNGSFSSDNEIFVHGMAEVVSTVVDKIQAVIEEGRAHSKEYETSLRVPNSVLPRLIGKNGSNMNTLRQEFGVQIDVDDLDSSDSKIHNTKDVSGKTAITLKGLKMNVDAASMHIALVTKKWADETILRTRVEREYHGRLIGANGMYINRLQSKYNVKIKFPNTNGDFQTAFDEPKSKDEITIRGPSKGVSKAEEELLELYKYEKDNGYIENVAVPLELIPKVLGKNHEVIRDIADAAGVEYRYRKHAVLEAETGLAEITLVGSRPALKEAQSKLNALISELQNFVTVSVTVDPKYHRYLIGPCRMYMTEIIKNAGGDNLPSSKYNRLIDVPNEGSSNDQVVCQGDKVIVNKVVEQIKAIVAEKEAAISSTFDLPKNKHRLIVGPGGSIRRNLEAKFKVTIKIAKPESKSTSVSVEGLPENVQAATAEIFDLTKDLWKSVIDIPAKYHANISERGSFFKTLRQKYNVQIQHGDQTKLATTLIKTNVPLAPESANPSDKEAIKFSIVPLEPLQMSEEIIPWRILGTESDAERAAAVIKKRLDVATSATSAGWLYCDTPSYFSRMIGPGGSNVEWIRNECDVFVRVSKNDLVHPNFAYFIGSQSNLKKAEAMAKGLLESK